MPREDVGVFQEARDFREPAPLEGGSLELAREQVTPSLIGYDKEARRGGRGQEQIIETQQARVDRRGVLHFEQGRNTLSGLLQPDQVHFACEGGSSLELGWEPFD